MNHLDNLQVDLPRGVVVTTRGEEIPIKEHNGWKFINYQGKKVGISKLRNYQKQDEDPVYNYIFDKGFINFPCPAMDYWIIRHRMAKKISYQEFKVKYRHTFIHFKPHHHATSASTKNSNRALLSTAATLPQNKYSR